MFLWAGRSPASWHLPGEPPSLALCFKGCACHAGSFISVSSVEIPYRYLFLPGPIPDWAREHLLVFQPLWRELVSGRFHEPQSWSATCWLCSWAGLYCRTQFPLLHGRNTSLNQGVRMQCGAREVPSVPPHPEEGTRKITVLL